MDINKPDLQWVEPFGEAGLTVEIFFLNLSIIEINIQIKDKDTIIILQYIQNQSNLHFP